MAKLKTTDKPSKATYGVLVRDSRTGQIVARSRGKSGERTIVVERNAKTGRWTNKKSATSIDKNVSQFATALKRLATK